MIKKLRMKLIMISMVSLLLVLTVIIGSVNIINYHNIVENADSVLELIAENGGKFPKGDKSKVGHKTGEIPKMMSPETPYESRFFSVLLNGSGKVISVDTGKIVAIDTSKAIEYSQNVWNSGKNTGFLGDYRYIQYKEDEKNDEVRVIFLDCGRSLFTFQTFLITSCAIAFAGLAAVLILMIGLSQRIIRPISESYEKQKQFITDAGHEIKTPLAIIAADADVLEMDLGENEWILDIQNQTKRLTALTNDLIYLSRMEEGKKQFQMIDFPVSDVINETAKSFQALAKTQKKQFTCQIKPMLSLYGDEKAIRQLVSILLDNALKYSPEGGRIELSLDKQGRMLCLKLFNTTVEIIRKKDLDRLFDRFYRVDSSRSSQTGGYGIGLSMAKAIVTAHRGKITATAREEKSLLITALLPMISTAV